MTTTLEGSIRFKLSTMPLPPWVHSPTTSVPLSFIVPLYVAPAILAENARTPSLYSSDSSVRSFAPWSGLPHLPDNNPSFPFATSSVIRNEISGVTITRPSQLPTTPFCTGTLSSAPAVTAMGEVSAIKVAITVSGFIFETRALAGSPHRGKVV
jgi:hypothetical protein